MHPTKQVQPLIPQSDHPAIAVRVVPQHVGMVLHGYRRWAQEHAQPGASGLARCTVGLVRIVRRCLAQQIDHLTLYAFTDDLCSNMVSDSPAALLFQQHLRRCLLALCAQGVRVRIQGNTSQLGEALQRLCLAAQDQSAAHRGMTLRLAFDGCQTPAHRGSSPPAQPELLIRTGGPLPLWHSLFWDTAETALYIAPHPWPDLSPQAFDDALTWFARPDRLPATRASAEPLVITSSASLRKVPEESPVSA